MAERDPKTLSTLFVPDFVSEDTSGKTTSMEEMLNDLAALPKDIGNMTEANLVSIDPQGNFVIGEQRYHDTVKTLPDGNKQAIDLVTLSTDTWAHTKDK